MPIIVIANQKGGVAKTTTTVNLADEISRREGNRVLIVDLDSQGHVAPALGLPKEPGASILITDGSTRAILEAMRSARPNLCILPSDKSTATAADAIEKNSLIIHRALKPFRAAFSHILIDTGPGLSRLNVAAIMAADHVLIPTLLDHMAIDGMIELSRSVMQARAQGVAVRLSWIVPTFYEKITNETKRIIRELAAAPEFGTLVTGPIPDDVRAREAPARGETLHEWAPTCRAALAYLQLAGRVLGDLNGNRERKAQ